MRLIEQIMKKAVHVGLVVLCLACAKSPGHKIYIDSGCARCHGSNLQGGALGPPLKNLKQVWNKEALARFLEDPAAYTKQDDRLKAIAGRYRTPMPKFVMREKTRKALVEFLLKDSE